MARHAQVSRVAFVETVAMHMPDAVAIVTGSTDVPT